MATVPDVPVKSDQSHAPVPLAPTLDRPVTVPQIDDFGPHCRQPLFVPQLEDFGPLLAAAFPGPTYEVFDVDGVRRDNSSFPVQHIGNQPLFEPPYIYETPFGIDGQSGTPRFSPAYQHPPFATFVDTFAPLYTAPQHHNYDNMTSLDMSQSPDARTRSFSGAQVMGTPVQPHHIGMGPALNIPQSPFMMGMNGFGYGYGFPHSPILSPSMNPNNMTGNYGPAAAAAAAAAAGNMVGRTVYVGNLPSEASLDELLSLVRFGPIENVRLVPKSSCCFISFLDGSTAAAFHADASVKKITLKGQELRIGWGNPSTVPPTVSHAVANQAATRNVFIGNLADDMDESGLQEVCSRWGPIDQIKIVKDKNIGFVHFLSIAVAMKVVRELPLVPEWEGNRVAYGKDRCAYVPRAQQAAVHAAQAQAAAAIASQQAQMPGTPYTPFTPNFATFGSPSSATFASPMFSPGGFSAASGGFIDTVSASNIGNRQIYLGNLNPETTVEELCNNIRGGMLQSIKHMIEKNIAFVTFIDPASALAFYNHSNITGLDIGSRRIKVNWGKLSGPLNSAIHQAVQEGASRNVYIGGIPDFDLFNEQKLHDDFQDFGEIEMINFLQEKGVGFVNFTNIVSAQKAVDGIKAKPEYAGFRIAFGKDRCANQPRVAHRDRGLGQRSASQESEAEGSQMRAAASTSPGDIPRDVVPVLSAQSAQTEEVDQEEEIRGPDQE